MKTVAILGPGLLGGSIALALREQPDMRVSMWARRREAIEEVRAQECCDVASTQIEEVVAGADLVVLATPLGAMPELAAQVVPHLKKTSLVTDVGSVKGPVVAALDPIFQGRARFVGSHPMAGSEQAGLKAARADLFRGAACIVTPSEHTDAGATARISAFWERLGCTVHAFSPSDHDQAVAWISHLPHLLAAGLVNAVASQAQPAFEICGPGFRDTTRVAGGHPGMWTEILGSNSDAVRKSLEALIENLRDLATLLDRPAPERDALMNKILTQAQSQRDRLGYLNQDA
ncbi:MAG: prephenate dehydrogenase [Chthoniobacteraceae bacterium]